MQIQIGNADYECSCVIYATLTTPGQVTTTDHMTSTTEYPPTSTVDPGLTIGLSVGLGLLIIIIVLIIVAVVSCRRCSKVSEERDDCNEPNNGTGSMELREDNGHYDIIPDFEIENDNNAYSSLGPAGQDEDRQYTAIGSHELANSNAPYDVPDTELEQTANNSPYYLTIIG